MHLVWVVNVSLLVSLELIGEGKYFATGFAGVLWDINDSLAVLACQMVLEMVFLHKLFATNIAFIVSDCIMG